MRPDNPVQPYLFPGVMISSMFTDLQEHRKALAQALDLKAVWIEPDSSLLLNVLDSSLEKVWKGSAYIGIIGHKYGQVPECPANPDGFSITEAEFREAQKQGRPILLFIMGDAHLVKKADVETRSSAQSVRGTRGAARIAA
jgi:hypothetical protein